MEEAEKALVKEKNGWGSCSRCGSEHCSNVAYYTEGAKKCVDKTKRHLKIRFQPDRAVKSNRVAAVLAPDK